MPIEMQPDSTASRCGNNLSDIPMATPGLHGEAAYLPAAMAIDLPGLQSTPDTELNADNIRVSGLIYASAMLEETKIFQVVDQLADLFQQGLLPIGDSDHARYLHRYRQTRETRLSDAERRAFYARTLGMPSGDTAVDAAVTSNRDFEELFVRFLAAVSSFVHQGHPEIRPNASVPPAVSADQLRCAARDLAINLSLHGFGISFYVANELRQQIQDIAALLSSAEIRAAFGARDMWQVVDQVAGQYLAGARNTLRYRTLATAGAIVIAWLGEHTAALSGMNVDWIRRLETLQLPLPDSPGSRATHDPTEADLVNASERWLAVSGTVDDEVEDASTPCGGTPARWSLHCLAPDEQRKIAAHMSRITSYLSRPADESGIDAAPLARSDAEFETLVAGVDFPAFVGSLINGVFHAIVESSIEQMRAYGELLAAAAETVDRFIEDDTREDESDDDERHVAGTKLQPGCSATADASDFNRSDGPFEGLPALLLNSAFSGWIDGDPSILQSAAALRRSPRGRQKLLATMVLMGINRIVVTDGKIPAR